MNSEYTLPGWKLRQINFLPHAAVVWLWAFFACWPIAYCLHLVSRVGDQARVERTLRDLDQLVDAVGKGYRALRTERELAPRDGGISISVRRLIHTGIAPASLISPAAADQPLGLFNVWGGPILTSVDSTNIRIDLVYIPARVCTSFLQRAHSLKSVIQLTTDGNNYLKPPIDPATARTACFKRSGIQFLFAAPDTGIKQ